MWSDRAEHFDKARYPDSEDLVYFRSPQVSQPSTYGAENDFSLLGWLNATDIRPGIVIHLFLFGYLFERVIVLPIDSFSVFLHPRINLFFSHQVQPGLRCPLGPWRILRHCSSREGNQNDNR
jgi:hypothetical protein